MMYNWLVVTMMYAQIDTYHMLPSNIIHQSDVFMMASGRNHPLITSMKIVLAEGVSLL
jgi:hypothetical protein